MINEVCQKFGFQPSILCRGDDVRSLLAWADAGIGVAIVLKSAIGLVPCNQLTYQEIAEPALSIKMSIIRYRKRQLSAVASNFLSSLLATRA